MDRKGFSPLIVIGVIAAIVVIGAIGYFVWRHSTTSGPATQISQSTSTNQSTGTGMTLLSPTIPGGTVIFSVNVGQFQISLSAKDQQQSTASGFCGANDGAVEYAGDYHLMSKNGSTTISNIDIGQTFFTADLPHDGIQEFTAGNGDKLLGIYEYEGCSNETTEFFKVGSNGIITPINFVSKDGSISQTETTGHDGSIPTNTNGDWIFCGYDNAIGFNLCDSFAYTGTNFSQVDSWAGGVFPVGQFVGPQPADEARRALIDYISNLDKKNCANGASSNTCLLYDSIQDVTSTLPNTFLFSVDFYQGVGTSTNGTPVQFSVQKTANGFNVSSPIPTATSDATSSAQTSSATDYFTGPMVGNYSDSCAFVTSSQAINSADWATYTDPNCGFVVKYSSANNSPANLSGWQTYVNSQYGFALKYPPSLYNLTSSSSDDGYAILDLESAPQGVSINEGGAPDLSESQNGFVLMFIYPNATSSFNINQWLLAQSIDPDPAGDEIIGPYPITIGGQPAYEYSYIGTGGGEPMVVAYHNGLVYQIYYNDNYLLESSSSVAAEQSGFSVFDNVIKSLTFTNLSSLPPQPPIVSGVTSTGTIVPGSTILVEGSNFIPGATIVLDFGSSIAETIIPIVNSSGTLSFIVPSGTIPGMHDFEVKENGFNYALPSDIGNFTVNTASSTQQAVKP